MPTATPETSTYVHGEEDMVTVVEAAKSGEAVAYYTIASGRRAASPDDPALAEYWAQRRRKAKPPLDNYTLRLLARQDARCPLCGDHLLTADQPPQSPNDRERWW